MWEALFAFHICIACSLPELLRRSVVQRAVRAFAVVLLASAIDGLAYIVQCAGPICSQAFVAQHVLKASLVVVLHGCLTDCNLNQS